MQRRAERAAVRLINAALRRLGTPLPSIALMYHGVAPGASTPPWLWSVAQDRFEAQMSALRALGYRIAPMCDWVSRGDRAPACAVVTFDDGYADNWGAFEWLAQHGCAATWFIVTQRMGRFADWDGEAGARRRLFSPAQLRAMHAAGMELGGHGRTHAKLAESSDAVVRDEVAGSKADLEDLLGAPVNGFAYPYGSFDERSTAAVAEAGYGWACSTRAGFLAPEQELWLLRRVAVYATDDLDTFVGKVLLGRNEIDWRKGLAHLWRRILQH